MMATEADIPATPPTDEASRLAVFRARLVAPMPDDRLWGWLGPLLVTAFGTFLRFNRLRVPRVIGGNPSGWSQQSHYNGDLQTDRHHLFEE